LSDSGAPRKLATIVALDVAGYSARTEADEAKTTAEVAALRAVIEAIAARHGGRVFNTAGDGFMLEFGSSVGGVEAAYELARTCEPKVRVGVHLGDVAVQPNGDLLGHGVNVAARLMARSLPGAALISADVRRTVRGSQTVAFERRGELKLDKMTETIEAFALVPQGTYNEVARSASLAIAIPLSAAVKPVLFGCAAVIVASLLTAPAPTKKQASSFAPGSSEEKVRVGPNCFYWATDFAVLPFVARKPATQDDDMAVRLTARLEAALAGYGGLRTYPVADQTALRAHIPSQQKDLYGNRVTSVVCTVEGSFTYATCHRQPNQLSIIIRLLTADRRAPYTGYWCGPEDQIVDIAVREAGSGIANVTTLTNLAAR
jgi:class 3 adenylate cyclase